MIYDGRPKSAKHFYLDYYWNTSRRSNPHSYYPIRNRIINYYCMEYYNMDSKKHPLEEALDLLAKECEKMDNFEELMEVLKKDLKKEESKKEEEEQKEEAPVIGPLPFHEILKCVLLNAEVTGKEMAFWRESKPEEVFYISYVRGKPYSIISEDCSPMFYSSDLLADDWYASEDPGED